MTDILKLTEMENRLSEISAEMLLNYLYPDLMEQWTVVHSGTFWRNYSNDAMSVDCSKAKVRIARDGILKLLPEGLVSSEDDLKGRDARSAHESIKRRKALLEDAFLPFDTFAFRQELHLEKALSEILESKENFILKNFFSIDKDTITDKYLLQAIKVLPFAKEFRGQYLFIGNLLSLILCCDVEVDFGKYSATDTSRCFLPRVTFIANMPGLDHDAYLKKCEDIKPLESFIKEWLVPAEVVCNIKVYSIGSCALVDETLLDYNAIKD